MLKSWKNESFPPTLCSEIFFCLFLSMEMQLLGKEIIKLFLTSSWIKIITCKPDLFLVFVGLILLHLTHWGIKMI